MHQCGRIYAVHVTYELNSACRPECEYSWNDTVCTFHGVLAAQETANTCSMVFDTCWCHENNHKELSSVAASYVSNTRAIHDSNYGDRSIPDCPNTKSYMFSWNQRSSRKIIGHSATTTCASHISTSALLGTGSAWCALQTAAARR